MIAKALLMVRSIFVSLMLPFNPFIYPSLKSTHPSLIQIFRIFFLLSFLPFLRSFLLLFVFFPLSLPSFLPSFLHCLRSFCYFDRSFLPMGLLSFPLLFFRSFLPSFLYRRVFPPFFSLVHSFLHMPSFLPSFLQFRPSFLSLLLFFLYRLSFLLSFVPLSFRFCSSFTQPAVLSGRVEVGGRDNCTCPFACRPTALRRSSSSLPRFVIRSINQQILMRFA